MRHLTNVPCLLGGRGMRSKRKVKAKKGAGVEGQWRYEITSQIVQSGTVGGVDPYSVNDATHHLSPIMCPPATHSGTVATQSYRYHHRHRHCHHVFMITL